MLLKYDSNVSEPLLNGEVREHLEELQGDITDAVREISDERWLALQTQVLCFSALVGETQVSPVRGARPINFVRE